MPTAQIVPATLSRAPESVRDGTIVGGAAPLGVPIVRIGCREFKCIGEKPPQDHPHIYLTVGDTGEIICPYCATLFRYDPSLGAHEADPAGCAYVDME